MFGHKSQPSVMYAYGAWEPVEGRDRVEQQMRQAHKYRNALVRNERNRRAAVECLLRELSPELVAVDGLVADAVAARDAAREAIQEASVQARKRVRPRELVEKVKQEKANLKILYDRRKTLRKELFASASWKDASASIEEKYHARALRLRAASGVYWGTYLHVEQSLAEMRKGAPPEFARWRGDGHLAVQLQKGLTIEEAFSCQDPRIRIEPLPEPEPPDLIGPRLSQARRKRTRVWLRVGSDGRAPVWAVVPIVMHRAIPSDAQIKWVHLTRRLTARDERWEVIFSLARASGWAKEDRAATGDVAIDVGWRIRPGRKVTAALSRDAQGQYVLQNPGWTGNALRVAYWRGSDGEEGELCLPPRWLEEYKKTYDLQAIRRGHFNRMQELLVTWLKSASVPAWLAGRLRGLAQWKSAERLLGVVEAWRDRRFPGDSVIIAALQEWRKRELHLWRYEAHRRDRLRAQRKYLYRVFAARLRRKYKTAHIEELDFRDFHVWPQPEAEPPNEIVRKHTRHAALSVLIEALKWSMADVVKVDPKHTTMRCIHCGHVEDFKREKLEKACSACGRREDQDRGAAVNIGRRARASQ